MNMPTAIRITFIRKKITYLLVEMDMIPLEIAAGIPEYAITKDMAEEAEIRNRMMPLVQALLTKIFMKDFTAVSYTHLDVYKRQEYIRTAIKFRYRLFPYLYSLMERAHETGLPIMEAMCSAFQNDPKCYEEGVDFMFGDSLLVANVVEKGAKTRKVYLPEGNTFYDFYTRTPYLSLIHIFFLSPCAFEIFCNFRIAYTSFYQQ